jgi:hypothetical protein
VPVGTPARGALGSKSAGVVTVALPLGELGFWAQEVASTAAAPAAIAPVELMISNLVIKKAIARRTAAP